MQLLLPFSFRSSTPTQQKGFLGWRFFVLLNTTIFGVLNIFSPAELLGREKTTKRVDYTIITRYIKLN